MKRWWVNRGFGFGLFLSGCLAASSVNAQQVIDLFEGRQDAAPAENLVVESVLSSTRGELTSDVSSLQIDRGPGGGEMTHGGQALRLPFERLGSSILVKAKVQGRAVYFLLDTGATYSTLTPEFARDLGLTPAASNPKTMSQTANGLVERTFGMIPRLELGDRMHSKVSFTLCESCGGTGRDYPIVGLLGLNVLRRYRMTIDDKGGFVELMPQGGFSNQRDDIMPWLDINFHQKVVSDGKVNQTGNVVKVTNLSGHAVQDIEIAWSCSVAGGESFEADLKVAKVAAKGSSEVRLPLPPKNCQNHQLTLHSAHW